MPIPKLTEGKGTPVPDWTLSSAALKKAQDAFRKAAAGMSAEMPAKATKKGTKKAAKKGAKKKKAASEGVASTATAISPLILIRHSDLILSKVKFRQWWIDLIRLIPRRKNQKDMTPTEWSVFINAINTIASPGAQSPTYQDFVNVHVSSMDPNNHAAHSWGVHTMRDQNGNIIHVGTNFLAWHREYLAKFEARLQLVNPLVTIPYWDWINDRAIPPQLSNPTDLQAWNVTRKKTFNPDDLPTQSDINSVTNNNNFTSFQTALESPHGWVHVAVGGSNPPFGTMSRSDSPADPLFWLHHSMVDKIWADWQKTHTNAISKPPNLTETLKPTPIITRKVSGVLSTADLGYVYA